MTADVTRRLLLQKKLLRLLMLHKRQKKRRNKYIKRFWIRHIFLKRETKGEFYILVRELHLFDQESSSFALVIRSLGKFSLRSSSIIKTNHHTHFYYIKIIPQEFLLQSFKVSQNTQYAHFLNKKYAVNIFSLI